MEQVSAFAETEADMVTAFTINDVNEAIGIAWAHRKRGCRAPSLSLSRPTEGCSRSYAEGGDRGDRCSNSQHAGLLHDQLRSPEPLRDSPGAGASAGSIASVASAPMPPPRAMRTRRVETLDAAIPQTLVGAIAP